MVQPQTKDELGRKPAGKLDALRAAIARAAGAGTAATSGADTSARLAVAFSAGVDSALLLAVAHDVLGGGVVALTAASPSIPACEVDEARAFCRERGIRHEIVETHEFDIPGFRDNPPERCYLCKREMIAGLGRAARIAGANALVEGSNADDDDSLRPGARAIAEAGVASPLREAGLTKRDVRELARKLGLSQWNKPSLACLNTRFPFGDALVPERLAAIDTAEEALRALGFPQVRVRAHGDIARVEVVPEDIGRLADSTVRLKVVQACRQAGFSRIALDLEGYRG